MPEELTWADVLLKGLNKVRFPRDGNESVSDVLELKQRL